MLLSCEEDSPKGSLRRSGVFFLPPADAGERLGESMGDSIMGLPALKEEEEEESGVGVILAVAITADSLCNNQRRRV